MQLFKVTTEHGADVVDPMDALQRLASPVPPVILDLRTENEFRAGHIAGARWLPGDDLCSEIASLPADREYMMYAGLARAAASRVAASRGRYVCPVCVAGCWRGSAGCPIEHHDN